MESPASNKSGNKAVLIWVGVIVAVCCACALIVAALGVVAYNRTSDAIETFDPGFTLEPGTPTPEAGLYRPPADTISTETVQILSQTIVPENDVYELACRLQDKCNVAKTLSAPAVPLTVGTTQKFWILNVDTNEHSQVEMTLLNITPLTYFWAENPESVNEDDMKALMDKFDQEIIPTNREFFGSEWTPGVDNDPHIYLLYTGNLGSSIGGYVSSFDGYNPVVQQYSNSHEGYVLVDSQSLGDPYAYSTLAHEFVHIIQNHNDRNDVSWINEGFAELGAFVNGYDAGGADGVYVQSPDLQLNDWATNDSPDFGSHYGQSFLYLAYFLDRFGEEATKALTANKLNDLASVDDTLKALNATDPQTGKLMTADDVFMDWAAAMYLMNGNVGDGRYTYHNYPNAPQTTNTETISICPQEPILRDVHQYGIDYINVSCAGEHTLTFIGSTAIRMLPADPNSGLYTFATNLGNESDMTLTREFDFTKASGAVTLSFQTWYDLEEDYDYLFVEVSEDGKHWDIITTPSGTDENPSGNSYGWGYNGKTNGWIKEEVDLSKYAGKKVQVRFEYVTDAAVLGEGFLLDDISVDAINYTSDFEMDDGGWVSEGFSRVENIIPQTFRLALIVQSGGKTTVQYIEVSADQIAEFPLSLESGDTVTLVITGTTRFTRESANYSIEIR